VNICEQLLPDIWSAKKQKTLYSQRAHCNSTFQGFMIFVLKAKWRFICYSHCDREQ